MKRIGDAGVKVIAPELCTNSTLKMLFLQGEFVCAARPLVKSVIALLALSPLICWLVLTCRLLLDRAL